MENNEVPLFNTHKIVMNLTDTGIKQKQAEVIVDAASDIVVKAVSNLATKVELKEAKTELKTEIKDSEHRVMMKIQKMSANIHKSISRIKTWFIGFMLTMFVTLFSMMGVILKIVLDMGHVVK